MADPPPNPITHCGLKSRRNRLAARLISKVGSASTSSHILTSYPAALMLSTSSVHFSFRVRSVMCAARIPLPSSSKESLLSAPFPYITLGLRKYGIFLLLRLSGGIFLRFSYTVDTLLSKKSPPLGRLSFWHNQQDPKAAGGWRPWYFVQAYSVRSE